MVAAQRQDSARERNRSRGRGGQGSKNSKDRADAKTRACLKIVGFNPCETGAFAMSDKPISPLRQRMIDDMTARRFSEDTQRDYVRNVRNLTAFLGRSPDTATSEDLRRFQLHMAQHQVSPSSINAAIAALRFFFTVTSLTRAWTWPVSRSMPARKLTVPWRLYSWSRAKVACLPGSG